MDCKDLMVGDWVYIVRGYDKHLTIEKIKGVIEDEDKPYPVTIFTGETVSLNDIKPIPLTENILDDNNFFQDHKYFTLGITKETRIVLKRIDGEDNKWYAGVITVFNEIGHAHIYYVHQLQHLLRLCGIEKELIID